MQDRKQANNTLLHRIVNSGDLSIFSAFVSQELILDREGFFKSTITLNNHGNLPINEINPKLNKEEKKNIFDALLFYTLQNELFNLAIMKNLYTLIEEYNYDFFQAGDSLLHIVIRHYDTRTCAMVLHYYERMNMNISQIVLTPNYNNKLPIDDINPNLSEEERKKITDILLFYALQEKTISLSQKIALEDYPSYHDIDSESELHKNLELAIKIINEVRSSVDFSSTHPQTNTVKDFNQVIKNTRCFSLWRTKSLEKRNYTPYKYASIKQISQMQHPNNISVISYNIQFNMSDQAIEKLINANILPITKARMGNCGEMAWLAYKLGKNNYSLSNMSIATYQSYQHIYNIIGSGENGVICDSWLGVAFPLYDVNSLRNTATYKSRDRIFNIIKKTNHTNDPIMYPIDYQYLVKKETVYSIILNLNNPIDNLLNTIMKSCEQKDVFLYGVIIRENISYALKCHLITEKEILSWNNASEILKKYFSRDKYFLPLLIEKYKDNVEFLATILKKNLERYAAPNQSINGGITPLMHSVCLNLLPIVKLLLENGANPNLSSTIQNQPIFIAIKNGYSDVVDELLNHPSFEMPHIRETEKNCLLLTSSIDKAARKRMEEFIQVKKDQNACNDSTFSISPRELAIIYRHTSIANQCQRYEMKLFSSFKNTNSQQSATPQGIPSVHN